MAFLQGGGGGAFLQGPSSSLQQAPNIVQRTAPPSALNTGNLNQPTAGAVAGNAGANAVSSYRPPAAPAAPVGPSQAEIDYNNLKNTTFGSINNAIGQSAAGYHSSILDYLDSERQQQRAIDAKSVNNELARQQGTQGVLDMVGNGVKSGGVVLANGNAGTSSAGEAIAKAYGTIGRQQLSSVGNQFAQGQNGINTDQANLGVANETQKRHTTESKANTINTIVNSATSQLASLNQSAAYASIPERVQIDQKIASVRQQALDALSAYDNELSTGLNSNGPQSPDAIRASATGLATAGTAPENAFSYTTDVPAELQNSGQFASSLPIFTSRKKTA